MIFTERTKVLFGIFGYLFKLFKLVSGEERHQWQRTYNLSLPVTTKQPLFFFFLSFFRSFFLFSFFLLPLLLLFPLPTFLILLFYVWFFIVIIVKILNIYTMLSCTYGKYISLRIYPFMQCFHCLLQLYFRFVLNTHNSFPVELFL